MDDSRFDFVIIGGGQAAIPLARALARAGRHVALAERKHLGGSCINFGCTPTKAAIASARVAHLARRGAEFGLRIPTVEVDLAAVLKRARGIVEVSRTGLEAIFAGPDDPVLIKGHARFEGRSAEGFRLRVGERTVTAAQVVLDTGTRSFIPPIAGIEAVDVIHAGNWLDRPELPARLVVIGGGYIGLEMAQFYRRLGSAVAVIEGGAQIAGHEDPEVASALQELLEGEGVDVHLQTKAERIEAGTNGLTFHVSAKAGTAALDATHLFVATGRRANTDDLGLETVGVRLANHGIVEVDQRLASSVPGVWVAGDIRGGPMFTHTSWDDYRVLESQLLGDGSRTTERIVPYGVFTDPELGRVGMTEREARQAGRAVKVARFEMKHNGKAVETGEPAGFIKIVVDAATDRLLGAAVLANDGAELVHVYIAAMNAGAPSRVIGNAVFIHPTLAEALQSAVLSLD